MRYPDFVRGFLFLFLCGLFVVAQVVTAQAADPGEVLVSDRWYVGDIGGKPAMSMHAVVVQHPDGSRVTTNESAVVIVRPGARIEMRERSSYREHADGTLARFRFDQEQIMPSGQITRVAAEGQGPASAGEPRVITGTLFRSGAKTPIALPLRPGEEVIGERRSYEMLARIGLVPGATAAFVGLGLMQNELRLMRMVAIAKSDPGADLHFELLNDLIGVPMKMAIDRQGELIGMHISLGFMAVDLRPSPGPVALLGGEVSPLGLVKVAGPAPGPAGANRYRLPAGVVLAADPFQAQQGDVVRVATRSATGASTDPAPLLAEEAQLEINDPALRAWALAAAGTGTPEVRAERLREAVRTHITKKDLGVADGSALDTFRSREGDCTEHANLLCAALRIAGIPARVEIGLVYAADLGGWCGHAWNSACLDPASAAEGTWLHLDAAYPGLARSQYLRLSSGGGGTLAALMQTLSTLGGKTIETLRD